MLSRSTAHTARRDLGVQAVCSVALILAACSGEGGAVRPRDGAPAFAAPAALPGDPALPTTPAVAGAPAVTPATAAPGVTPATGSPGAEGNPPIAAVGGGEVSAPDSGEFALDWEDAFDSFDASRWQLMTHSWDTNLAQFSTQNVSFANGILSLALTAAPADTVKPFRGVEMRSIGTLTYGKVEARVRLAKGPGVVSSLVTIYTPWPADNWNELDIEYLGRYSDRLHFNAMVYTGPPTQPPVAQSVTPTQFPELVNTAFDPSSDFHVYGMAWTPTAAEFSIDGVVRHVWNTDITRLTLPMNILLTIWASSSVDWAGVVQPLTEPVTADYDWLRVYRWTGAAP